MTEAGRESSMHTKFLSKDFMTPGTRNISRNLNVTVAVLLLISASCSFSCAQRPGGRRGSRGRSEASLAEPYCGIRSGGTIQEGLFRIESTGVSTQPVVDAAVTFLNGLNDEQRNRTTFPVDDIEWRSWDNRHFYKRRGVGFDEMDEQQRKHAFAKTHTVLHVLYAEPKGRLRKQIKRLLRSGTTETTQRPASPS